MTNPRRPVSASTLIQKINRVLDQSKQAICERPLLEHAKWGRYPFGTGYHKIGMVGDKLSVLEYEVDIEALGREIGSLSPYEYLEPKKDDDNG